MHAAAKAQIKECYEKNKKGDPAFMSLTTSMKARLRETVGETYWKKAHDYLVRATSSMVMLNSVVVNLSCRFVASCRNTF